jgi:hypothetical protein
VPNAQDARAAASKSELAKPDLLFICLTILLSVSNLHVDAENGVDTVEKRTPEASKPRKIGKVSAPEGALITRQLRHR